MNIYQKMSAITDEINKVAKNLKVGVGQSSYKAVGESDVLEAVKPIEIKHGVYSYPISRKIVSEEVFETENTYTDRQTGEEKTTKKTSIFLRVETTYRFVNIENPDEYVETITYGDGVDPQDKAPGKAMTYSDKYALLKAYKIETGDDPDQKASEQMQRKQPAKKEPKISLPTKEQLARLADVGGTIQHVAQIYKIEIDKVSGAMVEKVIELKLRKLAKEAEQTNESAG